MPAHQRRDGFGRALERDHFERLRVAADALHEQRCGDVVVGSEAGREADRNRARILLQALDQVLARLDRRLGIHCVHHVVVDHRGDRREVGGAERAVAGDVRRQQRRVGDHHVVRVAGVLRHVAELQVAAAARPVDDRQRSGQQLLAGHDLLDRARGLVVASAGRRADHDLHVLLRRPALRVQRQHRRRTQRAGGADQHPAFVHCNFTPSRSMRRMPLTCP